MLTFRDLKANEIDCRIAMVKSNGISLLLYKDARVDQNILDETVGAFAWQRSHEVIDGNLYCTVSIFDEEHDAWVSKQDVGKESNTEKEKGQASDSFKRACFNWGIGRELYTAPFIWIPSDKCKITGNKCYDKFYVEKITIENKTIVELAIKNRDTKKRVFYMNEKEKKGDEKVDQKCIDSLRKMFEDKGIDEAKLLTGYKAQKIEELTLSQYKGILNNQKAMKERFSV